MAVAGSGNGSVTKVTFRFLCLRMYFLHEDSEKKSQKAVSWKDLLEK